MKPSPTKLLVLFWLVIVAVCLLVSRAHSQFVPGGTPVFGTGTGSGGGSVSSTNLTGQALVQSTNIAAYQAQIATNNVMQAVTNTTLALDVRRFFSPQDQNLYLSNTLQRAKAGKHLRILNFGDDAFHPRDGALATISTFRRNYGGVGESPSFYADRTADVVQGTLLAGTPIRTYGMPTGSWMSNRTAILTDKITLQYWKSNAFGTLTIYTNNGSAGAYGVVAVVDGNNSTTLTAATTNFTISPSTVKAYILSTGTNFINMVGQYYENIGTNFSWDIWQDGNAAIVNTMTNAFTSNSLVTFLQNFDLAIFNDATLSNQVYLGHPLLWNAVTNRAPTCDILFLHQNPVTNQFGPSYDVRQAMSSFARDYGAPLLDTGGMLLPINPNVTSNYYLADGVHLSTAGNTLLGSRVAGIIANPYWSIPNANPAAQAHLLSTKVAIGSAVSLTTDTAANVASLALGAGEWVVSGNVNLINGGGTTLSGSITSIGTTSATLATDGTECYRGPGVASWNYEGATVPPVKITGPATVYLVTKATFTISTCSAFGSINAEQVR